MVKSVKWKTRWGLFLLVRFTSVSLWFFLAWGKANAIIGWTTWNMTLLNSRVCFGFLGGSYTVFPIGRSLSSSEKLSNCYMVCRYCLSPLRIKPTCLIFGTSWGFPSILLPIVPSSRSIPWRAFELRSIYSPARASIISYFFCFFHKRMGSSHLPSADLTCW